MARRPGALPKIFTGTHIKSVDSKGRVSVPPDFRTRFGDAELGLYVMRSVTGEGALDVFEPYRYARFVSNSEKVFSKKAMNKAFALFGAAIYLALDPEGRMALPEVFRKYADIDSRACFIGLGLHFQIWNPDRGMMKQEEAFRNAIKSRENIRLPLADLEDLGS